MQQKEWFQADEEDEKTFRDLGEKEQIRRTMEKAMGRKVYSGADYKTFAPDEDPDELIPPSPPRSPWFYVWFFGGLALFIIISVTLISLYVSGMEADPSGAAMTPAERLIEGLRRGFGK